MIYGDAENPHSEFFMDEVREGFFVTSMMKRYWAAQIKVLSIIDAICERHGLRWFADCGTLLGAVRHGGYIPWDDDLDICMFRSDYKRLCEVADSELPVGYRFLNVHKENEYEMMIGRIVNSSGIDYSRSHLDEYFGCPYTIGIDIFVLDGLAKDDEDEETRIKMHRTVTDALGYASAGGRYSADLVKAVSDIENYTGVKIDRDSNIRHELYMAADRIFAMYPDTDAEYVALMPFWTEDRSHRFSKSFYEHTVYIPFEYIRIPVPYRYEEVLAVVYGDYMRVYKGGGMHDYPVYREQEDILRENLGANPFRYTMPAGMPEKRNVKDFRERCEEMIEVIRQAQGQIGQMYEQGNLELIFDLLTGCQNLAVTLGTLLEERVRDSGETVKLLEEYCEKVYEASVNLNEERLKELAAQILLVDDAVITLLRNRKKEILFLSCRHDWWGTMKREWQRVAADPSNEVHVMPVPYSIGGTGEVYGACHEGTGSFQECSGLVTEDDYDIEKRHPDAIYLQNPYDGWNPVLSVPERFYSRRLSGLTDELVYIPPYDTDDPAAEGDKLSTALRTLIEQPAVRNSDRVVVASDALRNHYVDTLVEICGSGSREYWEDKVTVSENLHSSISEKRPLPGCWTKGRGRIKYLIFQVNAAFVARHKSGAISKIEDALEIMKQNREGLVCIFSPHETLDEGNDIGDDERKMWEKLIKKVSMDPDVIYDGTHMANEYAVYADAYYGSSGLLAHRCAEAGMPVMIMSVDHS